MPLYDFKCGRCGVVQEHHQSLADYDGPTPPCDTKGCKGTLQRQIAAPRTYFERSPGWDGWDYVGPGTVGRVVPVSKHMDEPPGRNPGSRKASQ